MKKYLFLFMLAFSANIVFAQETCESKEESLEDLNSITKCTIEPAKKTKGKRARQISVSVSAPKRRFLKKRKIEKKSVAHGVGSMNSSGVSGVASSNEISKTLELKSLASSLGNKLSAEEVKKAKRFSAVEKIPVFVACDGAKGDERLDCFNTEMIKHIQRHFNYPSEAVVKKIQGEVWVRFIIDKNGNVTNIKTLGPENGELLSDEAKRVVSKLPTFIPGKSKGKVTSVKYGFPINFSLDQ